MVFMRFLAVIFICFIFNSCSGGTETGPNVYVGGAYSTDSLDRACYWVNGKQYKLDGGIVRVITAVNNKVYMAGFYRQDNEFKGCYWIGSARYDLPGLVGGGFGIGRISVMDNNVFVIGNTSDGVRYWINGVMQELPPDAYSINDLYAINGSLYISGSYLDNGVIKPCYWINKTRKELPAILDFNPEWIGSLIDIENNKVYIVNCYIGPEREDDRREIISVSWLNGIQQHVLEGATFAFAVSNGDIFMCGDYGDRMYTKCYKNGVYYNSASPNFFSRFAVSRGRTYTAASGSDYKAGYFIDGGPADGERVELGTGAYAVCIYVDR